MKISYAIPVCNEHVELERLLNFLVKHIREEDEIVIQCDDGNTTPEVYEVLGLFQSPNEYVDPLTIISFPLDNNFANFKNNLKRNCTGDYIFQIDADEYPHESLITQLPVILEANPENEVYLVPRVNTVEGLTNEHIQKWGWNVNDKNWINWPDYQWRVWKNKPEIKWVNKVHEKLSGHKTYAALPDMEGLSLYHPKKIDRQEKQNAYYNTL
tara:strand:- start:42 stop:677 length:636 start_codon:yes stop_codon:yes gene_type:complete